jgi:hypothetical protein
MAPLAACPQFFERLFEGRSLRIDEALKPERIWIAIIHR